MYRKVCIPLDGSYLAEKVLPYVQHLFPRAQAELLLISNVTGTANEMRTYLAHIAEGFDNARVSTQIVTGGIAESIVRASDEFGADVIAMSTHGRSGFARATLGSVADSVVRMTSTPVFLAPSRVIPGHSLENILVPLDGSELSTRALPAARMVAEQTAASLLLMTAVDGLTPAQWEAITNKTQPGDNELVDKVAAARRHLMKIAHDLPASRSAVRVSPGEAAETILRVSQETLTDLIVLCTHGRSGYDRWRHGSVASELMRSSSVPMLIVGSAPDA